MAPICFENRIREYLRDHVYRRKSKVDMVKLNLDFEKDGPKKLANKYKGAIDQCRNLVCPKKSRKIYGNRRFRQCQHKYDVPYFLVKIIFKGRGKTYKQSILIEKETIYLCATTLGSRDQESNKWYLLKDGGTTDVQRFVEPWFIYGDLRYGIKPQHFSRDNIFNVVSQFHDGENSALVSNKLTDMLNEALALLIYLLPESIRFNKICSDIENVLKAEEMDIYKKTDTRFELVNNWSFLSKKIKSMNVGDNEKHQVTKAKHGKIKEPKKEDELFLLREEAKLAKETKKDDLAVLIGGI